MKSNTGKRLLQYALKAKGTFIAALIMLTIGVAAELAGPFIAKSMIDNHLLAIEQPFYETTSSKDAAVYQGKHYKREGMFAPDETKGAEVRVLQAGKSFYFVNEPVSAPDGDRTYANGTLTVTRSGEVVGQYVAAPLSAGELFAFYKPEMPGIYQLIVYYLIFLVISIIMEFGKTFWLQSSANKVIQRLRNDVYAHIQRLPVNFLIICRQVRSYPGLQMIPRRSKIFLSPCYPTFSQASLRLQGYILLCSCSMFAWV